MPTHPLPASRIFEQLSRSAADAFRVEEHDDNTITITTPFQHIYGYPIVLYLLPGNEGTCHLTDNGETRQWLNEFKGHDTDRRLGPINLQFWLTECELFQTQVGEGHELMTVAESNDVTPAVFRLLQTIMHISGLGIADND